MIEKLFHQEGPLLSFLEKMGQMVFLSAMWIAGCIPIVTIATSTTAFYYGIMKVVRRGRGNVTGEFWRSYKANLGRGIITTMATLLPIGICLVNLYIVHMTQSNENNPLKTIYLLVLLLLAMTWMYVGPVLSRFSIGVMSIWRLSFLMAVRFLPVTLLLLIGTVGVGLLQFFLLPVPAVLLTPAIWCYLTTFLVEPVLRKYMPQKTEEDDAWYYE